MKGGCDPRKLEVMSRVRKNGPEVTGTPEHGVLEARDGSGQPGPVLGKEAGS